jgi:polysaccharide lyase-like protein
MVGNGTGGIAAGGASMDVGGSTGTAPTTPPPVTPPPVAPPVATGPDIPCPADATFCSGFEGAGLPAGSQFQPTYLAGEALSGQVSLDTTVVHAGSQSLHMPAGANYYRMLAVPVPSSSFWVRLYTRSDVGFGAEGSTHATLFMASTLAPDGDYNGDSAVEIAEQFGQVLLNVKDSLFGTSGTNPNGMPGTRLPDDTWTCMEAQFDGPTGDVRVFVDGDPIIDATGWQPATTFSSFRFGYLRFDSPARDVWMDDVVVAASRIGCQ